MLFRSGVSRWILHRRRSVLLLSCASAPPFALNKKPNHSLRFTNTSSGLPEIPGDSDDELRSPAGLALDCDRSLHQSDDPMTDAETEPRSFSRVLRGEERVENLRACLLVHADAVVDELQLDLVARPRGANGDAAASAAPRDDGVARV